MSRCVLFFCKTANHATQCTQIFIGFAILEPCYNLYNRVTLVTPGTGAWYVIYSYIYRPFHKTLLRSSAFVNWSSVRFYETVCIMSKTTVSIYKCIHNYFERTFHGIFSPIIAKLNVADFHRKKLIIFYGIYI